SRSPSVSTLSFSSSTSKMYSKTNCPGAISGTLASASLLISLALAVWGWMIYNSPEYSLPIYIPIYQSVLFVAEVVSSALLFIPTGRLKPHLIWFNFVIEILNAVSILGVGIWTAILIFDWQVLSVLSERRNKGSNLSALGATYGIGVGVSISVVAAYACYFRDLKSKKFHKTSDS
ncbi:hypothetical protein PMAYCL1PPCAC_20549, partial [Pristionchus mayeri]